MAQAASAASGAPRGWRLLVRLVLLSVRRGHPFGTKARQNPGLSPAEPRSRGMMTEAWPWLVLIGLGALHGLNPAMGWLFAVALGLHRASMTVVVQSLVPIALGHAASVFTVAAAVAMAGTVIDGRGVRLAAGGLLIGWAAYHAVYGHRHRVRFGMQVGLFGLGVWSALMAAGHGAGLMIVPALIPLCLATSPAHLITADTALPVAVAAASVHTTAMLI